MIRFPFTSFTNLTEKFNKKYNFNFIKNNFEFDSFRWCSSSTQKNFLM